MKNVTNFIRPLGLVGIFLFAVLCIFSSIFIRDLDPSSPLNKFVQYTIGFENRFYDFRLREQENHAWHSEEIALVEIDDESLHKIGNWPIPRSYYTKLINKLDTFGAKVVALDILLPEKSPLNPDGTSPDEELSQAFEHFARDDKRVFLSWAVANSEKEVMEEIPGELFNDTIDTHSGSEANLAPYKINKFSFPNEVFLKGNIGLGSITTSEDVDGIFRQYLLAVSVDTIVFGSLGLNAYEAYTGTKSTISINSDSTAHLKLEDDYQLEINERSETKIRYIGGINQFDRASLWNVINASDDDEKMLKTYKNKIVYLGSTALGAHDLRPSPIDSKMPGVLSHMNFTQMLLSKHIFKPINDSIKYSLLILLLGMLLFFFVQKFNNALFDFLTLSFIIASTYYLDRHYLFPEGYELKLFYCYFCFIASYSWNTLIKFYDANKEKKQIKGTFSRYVAPTIVDEMLRDPSKLQIGGTKKDITCLFSDVRDFTSISEKLSASDLASSLNYYMTRMTNIVFETKGTIDKYIGDAIVSFWGAPLDIGNHAQYAVDAAIKMVEALPEVNKKFIELNRPLFEIGIGINSGECSVGNMGSERIFSYTALGDNMNLGSRLESLCKNYGTKILISESTLNKLDTRGLKIRPIDKVIVKGKTKPVSIYEVLTSLHDFSKNEKALTDYQKAFLYFQQKNFTEAKTILEELHENFSEDKPTLRLLDMCQDYLLHPEKVTDSFDVTKMTEK